MSKVIFVTGASSGLGYSIAIYLSKRGYKVYGSSRSGENTIEGVIMLKMDVTKPEEVKSAVEIIFEAEGRIDVLINNAGISMAAPLENSDSKDFSNVIQTNVVGPFETTKAVLEKMRAQKSGHIINVSSIASKFGLPYRSAYCASKAALDGMTEALRMEVKGFGIQVCSVQPGDIRTNINDHRLVSAKVNPAYEHSFSRCHEIINTDVNGALEPEFFARAIEKIIHTKKVKRAYILGKPMQKITVFLKRILPDAFFEKIIMEYYKVR